jgi:exodeoxyribonuclease VIII
MQIMLDIETMGNGSQAAIIAIGAVAFDLNGVYAKFYAQCSLESSVDAGLVMDPSTVIWWLKQSDQARAAFNSNEIADTLGAALSQFSGFCWENQVSGMWGNGATFDNVIMSNAYRLTGLEQPWKFWHDRCYRTIKSLYPSVKLVRTGTHHNAVDDAESQAVHLIDICKTYGVTL